MISPLAPIGARGTASKKFPATWQVPRPAAKNKARKGLDFIGSAGGNPRAVLFQPEIRERETEPGQYLGMQIDGDLDEVAGMAHPSSVRRANAESPLTRGVINRMATTSEAARRS